MSLILQRAGSRATGIAALVLGLVLVVGSVGPAFGRSENYPSARPAAILPPADDALLDEMERAAFRFFVEQSDPRTGLVRDRARADGSPSSGKASIAASGFGLSAWAVAVQRGWVDRPTAVEHVRLALRFLATQAPRHRGFFYHFMDMDTGARAWKCELSPIDTGLFFGGAIMAREYFADPEITALVDRLYGEVDWNWFLNGGKTLAMSWHDESGFSRYRWEKYSEHMMLSLLGLGAQQQPVPASYWANWLREPVGTYAGYHYMQGASLFVHQFTHAFVDFRDIRDAYADYYRNSTLATLAQRQFCLDLRTEFPTWGEQLWGVTASDSATGYKSWGGPPRTTDANNLDGTIVPCAAAGSLPFTPVESMTTLRYMRSNYGDRIWKRYGFVDAFNPETGWFDTDVIGIDLGISLLQAENTRSGLVWAVFMGAPEVQGALSRAGFVNTSQRTSRSDRERLADLAAQTWELTKADPVTSDDAGVCLSAIVAARALGLVDDATATERASALLESTTAPTGDRALAEYAAALVTVRQAIPGLATVATQHLDEIDWGLVVPTSAQLGAMDRLAVFFQVAAGARPVEAWTHLHRTPEKAGPVYVLAPGRVTDQLIPGLWLDEREVINGTSTAQLAYARIMAKRAGGNDYDVLSAALLLEQFPAEIIASLKASPSRDRWLAKASASDRATFLVSLANFLESDCMREWFQSDALTKAGRAAIPDFTQEAFGRNNSIFWRYELAGPPHTPPDRRTVAVSTGSPRDKWIWTAMSGLDFKDSVADIRPDDPPLSVRFAFTWDKDALHYEAEVTDTPAGSGAPPGRRGVELFVNTRNDGLMWDGAHDFHFSYRPNGPMEEWFHDQPAVAKVRITPTGYVVDAEIKWSTLGLKPTPGLEFGIAPAVVAEGTKEWDRSLKLNWRFYQRPDDRYGLGLLRLE